mgnify:CR=1 FL=1
MIPKIIHYCWFGPEKIGKKEKNCIASWKKYCPDYEFRLWTESNYDVGKNKYMRAAYKEKKWSFVSDYARLDVIYRYGGIYLDTDVELLKGLDTLLDNTMFCGFENDDYVNFGIGFGAEKGQKIVKEIMDVYDKLNFYNPNGSLNLEPCPTYQSAVLKKHGVKMDNSPQVIDDIQILSSDYFCPISCETGVINITENTYGIHHYSFSWGNTSDKIWGKISRWTNRYMGKKWSMIICFPYRIRKKIRMIGFVQTFEFYVNKYLKKNHYD